MKSLIMYFSMIFNLYTGMLDTIVNICSFLFIPIGLSICFLRTQFLYNVEYWKKDNGWGDDNDVDSRWWWRRWGWWWYLISSREQNSPITRGANWSSFKFSILPFQFNSTQSNPTQFIIIMIGNRTNPTTRKPVFLCLPISKDTQRRWRRRG